MANGEMKDLIGRYATGSLTAEEQKRLFDAALDDQDLFDQIAQEQEIKRLLAPPGARDRLIHALQPPRRNGAWIFGIAATAALTVVLAVVLTRNVPKPQQVAVLKDAPPAAEIAAPKAAAAKSAPASRPRSVELPAGPPPVKQKAVAVEEPARDASKDAASAETLERKAENGVADRKEIDRVATAEAPATAVRATAPPAGRAPLQQFGIGQRGATGGQRQQAQQSTQQNTRQDTPQSGGGAVGGVSKASSVGLAEMPAFGFHYSVKTKGHLVLVPATDGYLSVKSNDAAVLFPPKRIAAGIVIDIVVPDAATFVSVVFSADASSADAAPTVRVEPEGTVQGANRLAVTIRIAN